jgi:YhcG PDDEXK nuclease domain
VLIDLKVGELTHQDLGQMQMYVNYNHRELTAPDENPPIGIVLCAGKSEAVVRYRLPEGNAQIFASRYKLYLPTEEELAAELQRELLRAVSGARESLADAEDRTEDELKELKEELLEECEEGESPQEHAAHAGRSRRKVAGSRAR